MGFNSSDWEAFAAAMRLLDVDGLIPRPGGSERLVRSVWIVDIGETVPRLLTAYPWEGKGDD